MKARIAATATACLLALAGCGSHTTPQSATGSAHPPGWGQTPQGFVLPTPLPTATPTAEQYDAVTVSNIPAHPFAVAGYTAGRFITWGSLLSRFPQAHHVSIAIASRYHADCADVEPGDLTPAQAGPWAVADIKAGFAKPCEYSDLSEMPAVKASLAAALGPDWRAKVFLWLAWYRFVPGLVAGYDAVQYSDKCLGRNLDCSTVSLAFLSIAQPPYVPPKPPAPKPKPGPSYNENFVGGFQRGFVVAWARRHHKTPPAPTFAATNRLAFNTGFQAGFDAGWKAAR